MEEHLELPTSIVSTNFVQKSRIHSPCTRADTQSSWSFDTHKYVKNSIFPVLVRSYNPLSPSKSSSRPKVSISMLGRYISRFPRLPLTSILQTTFQSPSCSTFQFSSFEKNTCWHYVRNAKDFGPTCIGLVKLPIRKSYLSLSTFAFKISYDPDIHE